MTIERFGSGGPWEDSVGYSRAVRCGPFVMTAGCTSFVDGELTEEGDPYAQAKVAFGVAVGAIVGKALYAGAFTLEEALAVVAS